MLKIEKWEVLGLEHAIRGMRNPLNSWDKSDSGIGCCTNYEYNICGECPYEAEMITPCSPAMYEFVLGKQDFELAKRLCKAGSDHRKFMRMINAYVDITASLKWWKQFDTYKVGTVANSCSTMHKISSRDLVREDFDIRADSPHMYKDAIDNTIDTINRLRELYLETNDKKYWDAMVDILPSSYLQKRTVMLNYETLSNISRSRRNHKVQDWNELISWIEGLPYAELIMISAGLYNV